MAATLLPAIFPIVASGALPWTLGDGLQFASVVALAVSFGLGMSATIHFLNRLRLEERFGEKIDIAVQRATVLMGPALIVTSIVLACGMVVTVFSSLPSLPPFGGLATLAIVLAPVAGLTILRPVTFLRSTRMTREADRCLSASRNLVHVISPRIVSNHCCARKRGGGPD